VKRALLLVVLGAAATVPSVPGWARAVSGPAPGAPRVLEIRFAADVNPVTQDWLNSRLDRAASGGYAAAVIVLDTPGGLSESMRKIVQKELSVKIPVIVYVSPNGARAASAGVWISEAADVVALAPGTNIGSSTPIDSSGANISSDLRRKVVNDAAASLRGLAETHGRNTTWADAAVRKASNLTADEALRRGVIDLVSPSLPELLRTIDGRTIDLPQLRRHFTLRTAGAVLVETKPGFLTRFLSTLIDPNVVSLLFLAGIAGIGFEIFHPGIVLPGALGGISLLTALFGFSVLPLSWAGLGLVFLGIALLGIDLHVPTHGALTVNGLLSLAVGLSTLFHAAPAPYKTSVPLVVALTLAIGGFWAVAVAKAIAVRHRPVLVGPQEIIGMEGVVRDEGLVFVHGELWQVHSAQPLAPGDHVRVDGLSGLTLDVHRV